MFFEVCSDTNLFDESENVDHTGATGFIIIIIICILLDKSYIGEQLMPR